MASYEDVDNTQTSEQTNQNQNPDEQVITLEDINLPTLAEELYKLLIRELKIERERLGWYQDW